VKVFPIHYFPPISWFVAALAEDSLLLEAKQHYRKQQYTNRMRIKASNRIMNLTIPIVRDGSNIPLDQKKISNDLPWQKHHWKSIECAYRASPYFEFFEDQFVSFFTEPADSLLDHNIAVLKTILNILGMEKELTLTTSYQLPEAYTEDLRTSFDPKATSFPQWFKPKAYTQVFEGFEADLSIFDLICNEGPNARAILRQSKHS